MPWQPVRVRTVTEDDLPLLLELVGELREQIVASDPGARARSAAAQQAVLEQRYRETLSCPDKRLVLAVCGAEDAEEVLGTALLSVGPASPLVDVPAVHMTHSVVVGLHRKRGAGRALVAAAAAFAEERGVEQLVVSVHPGSRDAARFFARLGFAPLAVRRAAPVAVVRRRLAQQERAAEPLARRRVGRPAAAAVAARVRRADAQP